MRYPRYTTFGDEELVAAVKTLTPVGQRIPDARTLREQANSGPSRAASPVGSAGISGGNGSGRSTLLKEHCCFVAYPDGATGVCRYIRIAPDWHQFQYRHYQPHQKAAVLETEGEESAAEGFLRGAPLPTQRYGQRFANTPNAIEEKARELAASAFAAAIRHEQRDRFRRATPPGGHKPDSTGAQFSAKRAKEIGGKYSLCRRLGKRLLPDGPLFDTLDEANSAWKERHDHTLLVACACRWKRRWETPRFSPLHADPDYYALVAAMTRD